MNPLLHPKQRALCPCIQSKPNSALTNWYRARFSGESKRAKRIGIVALARKLEIAWWRYLERGDVPEGAKLKAV